MKVGLEAVVSYFPEKIIKIGDLAYLDPTIPEGQEAMFSQPEEFRRIDDERGAEILAENVTRKALDSAKLAPSDIDLIIAQNIGGMRISPMVGTYIHHKLGFDHDTPVINIQNFCASFVDGINLAWNLVLSGKYRRILVVVVCVVGAAVSKRGWGIDQTNPLAKFFGDGSGAGVVSSENLKCEFLSYYSETLGEVYDHGTMELMPVANPELMEAAGVESPVGNYIWADDFFMDYYVEKLAGGIVVDSIQKALEMAGLTLSELDMIVIHHPQRTMYERWIEVGYSAGIGREKWKESFDKIGNAGAVDVAAKLAEMSEEGAIPKNSILALYPPGLGGHLPCMIIRWL